MEYHNRKSKIKNQKSKIRILAPAKINIGLLIKNKLPSGYHNIETIMVPIKLFDTLIIKKKDKGINFKTDMTKLPSGRDNLVVRAAKLFFDKTKIKGGADIFLEKRIPIGAGLGGGSSDAAQILLGLNQLFGNPLQIEQLREMAIKIGMDVPFFLYKKPCYATGRGDILKPIKIPKLHFVLYTPNYGISTQWAYENFDKNSTMYPKGKFEIFGIGAGLTERDFSLKILMKKIISKDLRGINVLITNSFESLVFSKHPNLQLIKNRFLADGVYAASLSGTGSSIFGLVEKNMIKTLRNNLRKDNIKVVFTESI